MYDARIGRRWDVDPMAGNDESPYSTFYNNPIMFNDRLGLAPGDDKDKDKNKGKVTHDPETGKKYAFPFKPGKKPGNTNNSSTAQSDPKEKVNVAVFPKEQSDSQSKLELERARKGEGKGLVIIFATGIKDMANQIEKLAKDYRIGDITIVGHGNSNTVQIGDEYYNKNGSSHHKDIDNYSSDLQRIAGVLDDETSVVLNACAVGGQKGAALVGSMANYLDAFVFANQSWTPASWGTFTGEPMYTIPKDKDWSGNVYDKEKIRNAGAWSLGFPKRFVGKYKPKLTNPKVKNVGSVTAISVGPNGKVIFMPIIDFVELKELKHKKGMPRQKPKNGVIQLPRTEM